MPAPGAAETVMKAEPEVFIPAGQMPLFPGFSPWIFSREIFSPEKTVPDREPVKRAVLTASCACARGKWTLQDERTVLTMTHGLVSFDRLKTEQVCSRVAKIILFERAAMRERGTARSGGSPKN